MPRLRSATGVVVNVSDEKAERLGSQYTAYAEEAPAKSTPKKASSSKTEK